MKGKQPQTELNLNYVLDLNKTWLDFTIEKAKKLTSYLLVYL